MSIQKTDLSNYKKAVNLINAYDWDPSINFIINSTDDNDPDATVMVRVNPHDNEDYIVLEIDENDEDTIDDFKYELQEMAENTQFNVSKRPCVDMSQTFREFPKPEQIKNIVNSMYEQALESIVFNMYNQRFSAIKPDETGFVTAESLKKQSGMSAQELLGDRASVDIDIIDNDMDGGYSMNIVTSMSNDFLFDALDLPLIDKDFMRKLTSLDLGEKHSMATSRHPSANETSTNLKTLQKVIIPDVMQLIGELEPEQLISRIIDEAIEIGLPINPRFLDENKSEYTSSSPSLLGKIVGGAIKDKVTTDTISTVLINNMENNQRKIENKSGLNSHLIPSVTFRR